MHSGKWIRAIGALEQLLADCKAGDPESRPLRLRLLRDLAHCRFRLNECNDSLRYAEALLRENPLRLAEAEANRLKFQCLLGLQRHEDARKHANKLIEADTATYNDLLLPLWKRYKDERHGHYNLPQLREESHSLQLCDTSALRFSPTQPCARLSPHATYVHPSVKFGVRINHKGRGVEYRPPDDQRVLPADTLVLSEQALVVGLHSDLDPEPEAEAKAEPEPKPKSKPKSKSVKPEAGSDPAVDPGASASMPMIWERKLQDQPALLERASLLRAGEEFPYYEAMRQRRLNEGSIGDWQWQAPIPPATDHDRARVEPLRSPLLAALGQNAFQDTLPKGWKQKGVGGDALFFLASFFNHSCSPNAVWMMIGNQIFVHTLREIRSGEELTVSYSADLANKTVEERQDELQKWLFTCMCVGLCGTHELTVKAGLQVLDHAVGDLKCDVVTRHGWRDKLKLAPLWQRTLEVQQMVTEQNRTE